MPAADSTVRMGPVKKYSVIAIGANVAMHQSDVRFNNHVAFHLSEGARLQLKDCNVSNNRYDVNPEETTTVYTANPSGLSVGCLADCQGEKAPTGSVLNLEGIPQGAFLSGIEPTFVALQQV
jgi:hypothetical protein